ncbi:hypothetical protein IEO21_09957 [Rhodonia placenta]|uniref:Acetyl-CoA synthetase-like protein n=1 Tax=Rhodonia placenta TaxID=104341 RepID=A0A8H7TX83_9APHY|nr:hypothetical protein IEO21_09957 [Postia placenta]
MAEIHGPGSPPPHIPDDLTVAQFMLDVDHESRPVRPEAQANPWMIEDATGRAIRFAEVRERTHGMANALYSRWKLVCIYSPNHVDYAIAVWAVHRLGAIITAANPAYMVGELEYQMSITKAKLLIIHPWSLAVGLEAARAAGLPADRIVLFDALHDAAPTLGSYPTISQLVAEGLAKPTCFYERRLRPGEGKTKLAFLSFSSGTTGKPKAVCIPHYGPIANVVQMAHLANLQTLPWDERKWRPGDVCLGGNEFCHIYGLVVIMHFQMFCGTTLVVIPKFNFVDILKSVERYHISQLPVVPPMVVLLCKHPAVKQHDLSSVRAVMSGAAPLSAELIHQLSQVLPKIHIGQGYGTGMTETCTTVSFPQIEQRICTPGSAGRLIPGIVARVVKPDGSLAGLNEPGQLVVKGPAMALRYMNNDEATRETFVDGWVYTGDEVTINGSAELFELLKVRGFQVAPAELEGHLLDHPDVSDVCVVGVPDDYSGELPLAFVVPSAPALERMKKDPAEARRVKASIKKHVTDVKVHYKRLAGGVEFVDVIPKNPSGKLLRRVLRDRAKEMKAQGLLTDADKAKL